jgi:hypothetical protein
VNPQYILVVAVIVLMGWFAIGLIYNLRRGDALLKWMQDGLPSIGQKTTFRWLGTSVAELVIAHAKKPFRRLETLLVFKPRDVFWIDKLVLPMEKLSSRYARFSLRRDTSQSNFEVHVPFPAFRTLESRRYFEALRELARAISERE